MRRPTRVTCSVAVALAGIAWIAKTSHAEGRASIRLVSSDPAGILLEVTTDPIHITEAPGWLIGPGESSRPDTEALIPSSYLRPGVFVIPHGAV